MVIIPTPGSNNHGEPGFAQKATTDPFDPAQLRLSQDFATSAGVRKVLLTVPVRKPDKSWFVRVHPAEAYRLQTAVLNLKEDQEIYLIERSLWTDLMTTEATFTFLALFTSITRQGTVFLWPIGLPGPEGKQNSWNLSGLDAAAKAMEKWGRVTANSQSAGYDFTEALADLPAPAWPDMSLSELLGIAFKGKLIDSMQSPVLRKLRGEV
ncbi:MAG TPA: hypothetical protein VHK01_00920 [Lacipirellulaceae bacterium]|jgi:hypothetical protein|nr:hypothetical protein [Lacipirellulaceae bacterium]